MSFGKICIEFIWWSNKDCCQISGMTNRPYYFQHESAYQSILENEEVGWQAKTWQEFRDPDTESLLSSFIERHIKSCKGKSALDLGCGTGPTSHFLTELGFNVLGIDVSPTAIKLAQETAVRFNKDIKFRAVDLLGLAEEQEKFDLIYDSHCLHCIVLESDRAQAFSAIHDALAPEGIFILDTMVFSESCNIANDPAPFRFDDNFILWHQVKSPNLSSVIAVDGSFWCPQRRILPVEQILRELSCAHLSVLDYRVDEQQVGQPSMLRAVCQRA